MNNIDLAFETAIFDVKLAIDLHQKLADGWHEIYACRIADKPARAFALERFDHHMTKLKERQADLAKLRQHRTKYDDDQAFYPNDAHWDATAFLARGVPALSSEELGAVSGV